MDIVISLIALKSLEGPLLSLSLAPGCSSLDEYFSSSRLPIESESDSILCFKLRGKFYD